MNVLFEIVRQSLATLWAHKLRSFLTMFGIAWGVGSLLLLVGLGEGFRSGNRREMAEFGKDIMFIFPGRAPAVARCRAVIRRGRPGVGFGRNASGPRVRTSSCQRLTDAGEQPICRATSRTPSPLSRRATARRRRASRSVGLPLGLMHERVPPSHYLGKSQ